MTKKLHKALLLASMSSVHEKFNGACIYALRNLNAELHLAANFSMDDHTKGYAEKMKREGIIIHDLPFVRGSLRKNLACIGSMKELFRKENFEIIHAHTETGGILTRLAMSANKQTKYVFTPHGMSFWKGSSLMSQLVYRPIEWWICGAMDVNIAINQEEYGVLLGWNKEMAAYIHGIGVDISKLQNTQVDIQSKRQELGIPADAKVLFSVGELNDNKNHTVILEALSKIKNLPENLYYLICGKGDNFNKLKTQAEVLGLGDRLVLAGFRYDVPQIFYTADYFVFPSYHEGLPVSVMDAMTVGLPVVGSRIRGNTDLIKDGEGGFLYEPNDADGFADGLSKIFSDAALCKRMGMANKKNVTVCDIKNVQQEMFNIYSKLIK